MTTSLYRNLFQPYIFPGLTNPDEVAALTHETDFVSFVADFLRLAQNYGHVLFIKRYAKEQRVDSQVLRVTLCLSDGSDVFSLRYDGKDNTYRVQSAFVTLRSRGDRNTLESKRPAYILRNIKSQHIKVAVDEAGRAYDNREYAGVSYLARSIVPEALRVANATQRAVGHDELLDLLRVATGEINMSDLPPALIMSYDNTRRELQNRRDGLRAARESAIEIFTNEYWVVCYYGEENGICVSTIKIDGSLITQDLPRAAYKEVLPRRRYRNLEAMREVSPQLFDELYLQLSINRASLGSTFRQIDSTPTGSLIPMGDFVDAGLRMGAWWYSQAVEGNPAVYVFERV